jgi:hypothetical protein
MHCSGRLQRPHVAVKSKPPRYLSRRDARLCLALSEQQQARFDLYRQVSGLPSEAATVRAALTAGLAALKKSKHYHDLIK